MVIEILLNDDIQFVFFSNDLIIRSSRFFKMGNLLAFWKKNKYSIISFNLVFQNVVCIYDTFMRKMFVLYILVFEFLLY
jgi:hypothetical protein